MEVLNEPVILKLAAARAAFAAAAKNLPPKIKPDELLIAESASAIADRKRSDIEKILSKSALQPMFSACYSVPTNKPPSCWYVNGVQYYAQDNPPTEPDDTEDWIGDFFSIS